MVAFLCVCVCVCLGVVFVAAALGFCMSFFGWLGWVRLGWVFLLRSHLSLRKEETILN